MLDLVPARTIEQTAAELTTTDPQAIQGYLTDHPSRVRLLPAPATTVGAEAITEDQVGPILGALAAANDYVVVDTSAQLDGISLRAMDLATLIILVVAPEVPCVRRTKAVLALMQEWVYSRDKVKLIVNRARKKTEVSVAEIEAVLDYPVYAEIPDIAAAMKGISSGMPAVLSAPKSEVRRAFTDLGRTPIGMPKRRRRGVFRRMETLRVGLDDLPAPLAQPWPPTPPPSAPVAKESPRNLPVQPTAADCDEPDGVERVREAGGRGVVPLTRPGGAAGGPVVDLPLASRRHDRVVDERS